MAALDDLVAVLEGPGSRPVRHDASGTLSRGMLDTGTNPSAVVRGRAVELEVPMLYLAQHRLPALQPGESVTVGGVDAPAIAAGDLTYRVTDRQPRDDGLLHALPLDGGTVL